MLKSITESIERLRIINDNLMTNWPFCMHNMVLTTIIHDIEYEVEIPIRMLTVIQNVIMVRKMGISKTMFL